MDRDSECNYRENEASIFIQIRVVQSAYSLFEPLGGGGGGVAVTLRKVHTVCVMLSSDDDDHRLMIKTFF